MRILLTLLLIAGFCTCVRAQVGTNVDAEYASWCMVDSVGTSTSTRFTRLINIATLQVVDIDPQTGTLYTPIGILIPCETVDVPVFPAITTPGQDLYSDCQCAYKILQQDHRVSELRGGTDQDWTVEFQEVVTRQCDGQSSPEVIRRDTLTKTVDISTSARLQYFWNFTANGQYIDQVDFRVYTDASTPTIVSVDFNPSTVQASYPGLTLDPADFSYDGSNYLAMNAAFQLVLDEALPVTVNAVTTLTSIDVNLSIFTQVLHQPNYPYISLPWTDDTDRNVVSTIPQNKIGFGKPGFGTNTVTSTYAEQCEGIYSDHYGLYIEWDSAFPLALQPILSPVATLRPGESNETAFCDAPPSTCSELATSMVTLDGCVTICDTLDVRVVPSIDTIPVQVVAMPADTCGVKVPGHRRLTSFSDTYAADTYNSLSLTVISGTVSVTIDGITVEYPSGYSARWAAPDPCDRLSESFLIDANNGSVIIASLQ
jgi:hypothetical protein